MATATAPRYPNTIKQWVYQSQSYGYGYGYGAKVSDYT